MGRSEDDEKLWGEYNKFRRSGNKKETREKSMELYGRMKGLVHGHTNKFHYSGLPMVNVEAKGRQQFKRAIDTFDPKYGNQLSTHVTNYLKDVNSHVRKYKDIAKIPDHRTRKIDEYSKTKADLEVQYGREPNNLEMAEEMKWSINEVSKMEKELSRSELSDTGLQQAGLALDSDEDSRTKETIDLVYMSLTGEEKAVMERVLGYGGKKRLDSGKEIARALNMSPSKVSRVRGKIAKKIKQYS